MASFVGSRASAEAEMLLVNAKIIWFFNASDRSCVYNSSQMYPRVVKEASLMFNSLFEALLQRLGINSSHSFLGISMDAIADKIYAIYLLTNCLGDARVARIAYFIYSLNSLSKFIQKFSYFAS
jgi:hypothetical protein